MRTITLALRVCLLAMIAAIVIGVPAHSAASGVGPNQHYFGYVNNKHTGAVIRVICPGPSNRPGHPLGNQTVKVGRVSAGGGYTGSGAHQIWAQFNKDALHVVRFTTYDASKAIPTTLRLPCSGSGTVTFTTCFGTVACAADSKVDVVRVTFVNLAV